jgi:glycine cleavage system aminomethyltransferase T
VGFVTSAGYGPSVGRSIAYAWLPSALAAGDRVEIGYLGRILPAAVSDDPPFDPDGARLRAPGAASRRRT